jgi:hypothetical protein
MAVTFEVETGTGSETANSYTTVEYADDYLSIKANSATWLALSDTVVQNYLMWATRLLDQRATYAGTKVYPDAALEWPRNYVYDRNDLAVCNDCVPHEIQDAVVEIAYNLFANDIDPSDSGGSAGTAGGAIKRIKADVVEIEYTEGTAATSGGNFPPGLNSILAPLGTLGGGGGGMGFKRIQKV